MEDCAKAWTEAMMPLRVRNVPQMASQNDAEDQPHVPDLQHAALFLHHDRMQESCAEEPGHEGSVFDGIPSPVTAPSENGVGPVGAEEDATGEKSPGDHGPAAGDVDPFVAGILHDQRAQREGEGHRGPDITQVQHGRVDDHLGILEQGIEAAAIGAHGALEQPERIGGEIYQSKKKYLHARQNYRRVGEQAGIGFVAQAEDEAVSGQEKRPEEDGTFLARPEGGELIRSGKIAVAVMKDVGDGEIVAEGGDHEGDRGENNESENDDAGPTSRLAQTLPKGVAWKKQRNYAHSERIDAQRQCEEQGITTNLRHEGEPHCIFSETEGTGNRKMERIRAGGTFRKGRGWAVWRRGECST